MNSLIYWWKDPDAIVRGWILHHEGIFVVLVFCTAAVILAALLASLSLMRKMAAKRAHGRDFKSALADGQKSQDAEPSAKPHPSSCA